jgi:hypothetical protein
VQVWSEQQLEAAIGQIESPSQTHPVTNSESERKLENVNKEKKQQSLFDFK